MAEEAQQKQELEKNVEVEKVVVEKVVVDKKELDELLKKVSGTLAHVTEVIQGNLRNASEDAKKTAFKAVLTLRKTHVPELANQVAEMRKVMDEHKGWMTTGMQTDNEHATTGMQTDAPPSPEEVNLGILENIEKLSSRMVTVSCDVQDSGQHKERMAVYRDMVHAINGVAAAIRQPMSVGLNSTLAALQFDVWRQVPPAIPASGENDGGTEKSARKRNRKTAADGGDENPETKKKKSAHGKQSGGSKGDD